LVEPIYFIIIRLTDTHRLRKGVAIIVTEHTNDSFKQNYFDISFLAFEPAIKLSSLFSHFLSPTTAPTVDRPSICSGHPLFSNGRANFASINLVSISLSSLPSKFTAF